MRMVGSEDVDMVDTELQGGLRCQLIVDFVDYLESRALSYPPGF